MSDISVTITKREQKAIKDMETIANTWPKSLQLFGWSGTFCIMKKLPDGRQGLITTIPIFCDGGDPTNTEVEQSPEIEYA
jgi:hypothetical protein